MVNSKRLMIVAMLATLSAPADDDALLKAKPAAVKVWDDKGEWKAVSTGATIGAHLESKFDPVTAQRFRLNIHEAGNNLNIEELQ